MTSTTTEPDQVQKALAFRGLHDEGMLVLPNAWDGASAALIRDAGAAAVATTSAGAAWSLGTPDGERLPRDRAVDLISRITSVVRLPVSADIEAGYGATPDDVAETVQAVLAAGAVGVNLEDSSGAQLRDLAEQAERISAARAAADATDVPMFLNARTDTYLLQAGDPATRLDETVRRAEAYVAAGADGLFVPGLTDPDIIGRLTAAVPVPVNIMAGPGAPSVPELASLGVRRVSVGMAMAQAAYALTRRAALELLTLGTYTTLDGGLGYEELNTSVADTAHPPR